jgi:hypothetical protein
MLQPNSGYSRKPTIPKIKQNAATNNVFATHARPREASLFQHEKNPGSHGPNEESSHQKQSKKMSETMT